MGLIVDVRFQPSRRTAEGHAYCHRDINELHSSPLSFIHPSFLSTQDQGGRWVSLGAEWWQWLAELSSSRGSIQPSGD